MKVLDTNVLARLLVDDPDDPQAARQRGAAIAATSERARVPVTVLLELEWVMRGFYALPRADILKAMRALAGVEHLTIEDRDGVLSALDAYATGLDFADALHLYRNDRSSDAFVTFDRKLARRAARLPDAPPVELLG